MPGIILLAIGIGLVALILMNKKKTKEVLKGAAKKVEKGVKDVIEEAKDRIK